MEELPNTKLYKECPYCRTLSFGRFDAFCSRCGVELKDRDEWLAGIRDYAKSFLIDYLDNHSDLAQKAAIAEISDQAAGEIQANGNIMFSQWATRHILAECWNEVEIALDDWREASGSDFPVKNIEQLHVFAVTRHAEMVWREIIDDFHVDHLDGKTIAEAITRLKRP
jgi:hypothetical protein